MSIKHSPPHPNWRAVTAIEEFPLTIDEEVEYDGQKTRAALARIDYSSENGWTYTGLGVLRHTLTAQRNRLLTSHGQSVILWNEGEHKEIDKWLATQTTVWQFDHGLISNHFWPTGKIACSEWRLACTPILPFLKTRVVSVAGGVGNLKLRIRDRVLRKIHIPALGATVELRVGATWRVPSVQDTVVNPFAQVRTLYDTEIEFHQVQRHVSIVKSFMEFIWITTIPWNELGLSLDGHHAMYYKRQRDAARSGLHHFHYSMALSNFSRWLSMWCSMTDVQRRPLLQSITVMTSDALSIDLRLAMIVQAFEPWLGKRKSKETYDKFFSRCLAQWWKLSPRYINYDVTSYLKRLVWTRNEIVHLMPDRKSKENDLLQGSDRTRALHECIAVFRALYLRRMGCKSQLVRKYLERVLKAISEDTYEYY